MNITTTLRFFEGHPIRLEAKTFTIDDTIAAVAANCLKTPLDLISHTEAAREFLTQIEKAYEGADNLPWIKESHRIIHSLEGLEGDSVKSTIAKIKRAQTLYKERHIELNEETPAFLKADREFVLAAAKRDDRNRGDGSFIKWADISLRNDPDFMLELNQSSCLAYASEALLDNESFMSQAINKYRGLPIEWASERLKNKASLILSALRFNLSFLHYASDELRNDGAFMLPLIKHNRSLLQLAGSSLRNDEAFMLPLITNDGSLLIYASAALRDKETFVMTAIRHNKSTTNVLRFASLRLRDNHTFILAALKINARMLECASERLQDDQMIVTAAIAQNPLALEFASPRLKNNKMIVMLAILKNPSALTYASSRLKSYLPCIAIVSPENTIDEAFKNTLPALGFTLEDPVIKAILNYRNLAIKRYCMAVFFLHMIACHESKRNWNAVVAPLFEKKQWAILPLMIMAYMGLPRQIVLELPLDLKLLPTLFSSAKELAQKETHFILPPAIDEFLKEFKELFKDARTGALNTLLTLLVSLKASSLKITYLQHCLVKDNLPESIMRMKLLNILISSRSTTHIKALKDFSSSALLHDLLSEFIREGLIDESSLEAFKRTFMASRHPEAIFRYASLFFQDEVMKPTVKRFIDLVCKGSFKAERDEANSHKHKLTVDQKRIWEAGAHLEARYEPVTQPFYPNQFFITKLILDNHAPGKFSYLKSRLTSEDVEGAATEVEALCLDLIESPTLEEQLTLLRQLKEKLLDGGQFLRDVEDQIKILEKRDKPKDVTIYDSDDWQDLFYSGTEVLGSCQSIYADAYTNRCLLGYALDGKTRVICVKVKGDEGGPMKARAIIKILITPGGKPALFLERVYPPGNPAMDKLIQDFALARAHALGMDLYEAGVETILSSEGCSAPFEYEDARRGGVDFTITNGKYTIHARKVM